MIVCRTEQEQRVWDAAFGAKFAAVFGGYGDGRLLGSVPESTADEAVVALRARIGAAREA